jgi:hypothetical protein
VYVVYRDISFDGFSDDTHLLLKKSINNGDSFGSSKLIAESETIHQKIAAVGNNVYIAWTAGSEDNQEVFFRRSTNNGDSFGSTVSINNNSEFSGLEDILAVGNNVYIVWKDYSLFDQGKGSEVFFRKSVNNGASFGSIKNLSENKGNSGETSFGESGISVVARGNNVYVAWVDNTPGNEEIFFRASTNGGDTFSSTKNLSNNKGASGNLQMSSSGDAVRIVWQDNNSPSNSEVFFKESENRGTAFGSTKNLSMNKGASQNPDITSYSRPGAFFVAWQDDTKGNDEVYFRSGGA